MKQSGGGHGEEDRRRAAEEQNVPHGMDGIPSTTPRLLDGRNNLVISHELALLIFVGNDFSEICEIPFPVRFF